MALGEDVENPQEVADKVLRRSRVSKMARALQDRLALANVKIKHGWENRSIDSIEPEIQSEIRRKRTASSVDMFSDTSSSISGHCFSSGAPASSPLTGPIFSDDIIRSGSSRPSVKRSKTDTASFRSVGSHGRPRVKPAIARPTTSWKSNYNLPQSSPVTRRMPPKLSVQEQQNNSFASESSTIVDSPSASEEDDQDLPVHSFEVSSATDIPSSPPRTPPSHLRHSNHLGSGTFSSQPENQKWAGREGADLLLYLASSPSPAMRVDKSGMNPPSTPPTKNTPLPSSMMSTPGGHNLFGFAPTTPSAGFNFNDYVNVTPSPAQGAWVKTPTAAKTPIAARETRRRLNYNGRLPTTSMSPNITRSNRKDNGLGMDLGGDLKD